MMCGRIYGTIDFVRHGDGSASVRHADPVVLIAYEWFEECRSSPAVEVTIDLGREEPYECFPPVEGAILRITTAARTLVYRIGRFFPNVRMYEAEWPD